MRSATHWGSLVASTLHHWSGALRLWRVPQVQTSVPQEITGVLVESLQTRPLLTEQAKSDVHAVVAGNTQFAFDLLRVIDPDDDGNLVYSPYGLSVALAMLVAGTQGPTQSEITQALRLNLTPDRLHCGHECPRCVARCRGGSHHGLSSMWGQNSLEYRDSFLEVLSSEYHASVRLVDFGDYGSVAEDINSWVQKETRAISRNLCPRRNLAQTRS